MFLRVSGWSLHSALLSVRYRTVGEYFGLVCFLLFRYYCYFTSCSFLPWKLILKSHFKCQNVIWLHLAIQLNLSRVGEHTVGKQILGTNQYSSLSFLGAAASDVFGRNYVAFVRCLTPSFFFIWAESEGAKWCAMQMDWGIWRVVELQPFPARTKVFSCNDRLKSSDLHPNIVGLDLEAFSPRAFKSISNSDWENGPYSSTLLAIEISGFGWKNY